MRGPSALSPCPFCGLKLQTTPPSEWDRQQHGVGGALGTHACGAQTHGPACHTPAWLWAGGGQRVSQGLPLLVTH